MDKIAVLWFCIGVASLGFIFQGELGYVLNNYSAFDSDEKPQIADAIYAIPPTPGFRDIQLDGIWYNSTNYRDSLIHTTAGFTYAYPNSPMCYDVPSFSVEEEFQTGHGYTITSGDAVLSDTTTVGEYALGEQGVKIVTSGNSLTDRARNSAAGLPLNAERHMAVLIKVSNYTKLVNLALEYGQDSSNYWSVGFMGPIQTIPYNEWGWIYLDITHATEIGSPVRTSAINFVQLKIKDNNESVTIYWNGIAYWDHAREGNIIIWHDDGSAGEYDLAMPYLKQKKLTSVHSIIPEALGTGIRMEPEEALEMQYLGHELVLHDNLVPPYNDLTIDEVRSEVITQLSHGLGDGLNVKSVFVAPGGIVTDEALTAYRELFPISRATKISNLPNPPCNWNALTISQVINDNSVPADVITSIDTAMAEEETAILLFHNVESPVPANPETNISFTNYTTIIDHIADNYPDRTITITKYFHAMTNLVLTDEWIKEKQTDESRTSTTTLANDNELIIHGIKKNERYHIDGLLRYSAATTIPDFKFTVTVPSSSSGGWNLNTGLQLETVYGTGTASLAGSTAMRQVTLQGILNAGSDGSVAIQWAQFTSDAAATTLKEGSFLRVVKLGV